MTENASDSAASKKRKHAHAASQDNNTNKNRAGANKRVKVFNARRILTQEADAALQNGELDLQAFLKTREFEVNALEESMVNSKKGLNLRAFQQVPRDLRRRTASHNVKRVPKRIQARHKREMLQDNAPTVTANKRIPGGSRGRIRAETAKRLGILATKKKLKIPGILPCAGISTRAARPKIRMNKLNDPQKPKSKFRKRQIHKTWLPTHLWHAKRAKITDPKSPLWRFAIPLTCTEKSYRPTHRAAGARGTVMWDTSYTSTIGLEGPLKSIEKVLRAIGVTERSLWEQQGTKWRAGKRTWSGWLSKSLSAETALIGPSNIIWCPAHEAFADDRQSTKSKVQNQTLFIRIHPGAFLETWSEVLRLSKMQRPAVHATDLRFEIGSIELTGPGSTETLLGILKPQCVANGSIEEHSLTFKHLAGVTNAASLPPRSLLSFVISDPRLYYPPRTVQVPDPTNEESNFELLQLLSSWPVDKSNPSSEIFHRESRFKASLLPSQKAINRRKSLATPGAYPMALPTDPSIPVLLFPSHSSNSTQGSWMLMAPWKCILPIWYGMVHYPLSTGSNPRFGGIQELRQIHFEHGVPWFPADYPGTAAGFAWELEERRKRKSAWERRPKGKRIEWDSLDLGAKRKGEIGQGWACDFEKLIGVPSLTTEPLKIKEGDGPVIDEPFSVPIRQVSTKDFTALLSSKDAELPTLSSVATVRIALVSRGIANPCARVYRLPSPSSSQQSDTDTALSTIRSAWLALLPAKPNGKPAPNPKSKPVGRIPLNTPLPQRIRLLAQTLLQAPASDRSEENHPLVPDEEDLIGFVSTGEFNLAEGKGIAVGNVVVRRAVEAARRDGKVGRLCVVRNAGEKIGRLARWEPV